MRVTQRQVILALLAMLIVGALIGLIYLLSTPQPNNLKIITTTGLIIFTGLIIAYWRGWEPARYATLISVTLLIGIVTQNEYLTEKFSLGTFLPPALAMIIGGPVWIIGTTVSLLVFLIIRSGGYGIYTDPLSILIYLLAVGSMVLARMVTDSAQHKAEESAQQARTALVRTEAQALELAQKAQELEAQNVHQRQLLELVTTLETPSVTLADGVLLAPIVGHLDSRRAGDLTRRLLDDVNTQRARMVIIDITGVPTIDTAVAQAILRTIQAIRLLGCEVTVTGISASVAATMTQLGINMAGVHTARTPQEVIGTSMRLPSRPSNN